jgi:hypothetical protein
MQGLQKDSKTKEVIEKIDSSKAIRYKVVEEVIDLDALRREKEGLEAQLKEPTEKEFTELGRMDFISRKPIWEERIKEIDKLLK